jgi:hypothetical protein
MAGGGRNLIYYAEICLEGPRKGMKNLSQDSRLLRRHSSRAPPAYKSGMLSFE